MTQREIEKIIADWNSAPMDTILWNIDYIKCPEAKHLLKFACRVPYLFDEISKLLTENEKLKEELKQTMEKKDKAVDQVNHMIFELDCCDKCMHFEKDECTYSEEGCSPEWNGV